jgi:hypothetical protein
MRSLYAVFMIVFNAFASPICDTNNARNAAKQSGKMNVSGHSSFTNEPSFSCESMKYPPDLKTSTRNDTVHPQENKHMNAYVEKK